MWFNIATTKSENRSWIKKNAERPRVVRSELTNRKTLLLIAFTPNKKLSIEATEGESVDAIRYIEFVQNTGLKW